MTPRDAGREPEPSFRQTYGSISQPTGRGGLVATVEPGSPAERAGVEPGDLILTAEGLVLRDVIDWQWIADSDEVDLVVERGPSREGIAVSREMGEPWGVGFATPVFDRIRTCVNDCAFCFVSQLPAGLRKSLYVRDDDYRLSFLSGTFITLTNLTDRDVTRIVEQRLSPLHVSIHAVSPQVRERLVGCKGTDRGLERFEQLATAGIELHVQIVLVPCVNDGDELTRTLGWLVSRGETVASVGVVPLGFTGHQPWFSESYGDPASARAVIEALGNWQQAIREQRGRTWVQAADEFWLAAGLPIPTAEEYDGYPQFENGIGMVRAFMDDWAAGVVQRGLDRPRLAPPPPVVTVTGELFAPVLAGLLSATPHLAGFRVLPVRNRFLGGDVSVAGLLTGQDIADAIVADAAAGLRERGEDPGRFVIPDVVFNDDGLTLDDMSIDDLRERTAMRLAVVSSDAAALLAELTTASAPRADTDIPGA